VSKAISQCRDPRLTNVARSTEKEVGGNPFTIHFAHSLEVLCAVHGEIKDIRSLLVNQHPKVDIVHETTGQVIIAGKSSNVPSQVLLSARTESGTVLSYHMRSDTFWYTEKRPKDSPPMVSWRIFGSKGEIQIQFWGGPIPWSFNNDSAQLSVAVHDLETRETVELDSVKDELEHLPEPARNVARLYEAYASARAGDESSWYPDFDYALKRHEMLEEMYEENGF
jgi:hypothetical protein